MVSVQAISGAGSIEYFIFVHTYYKYTTGLVFPMLSGVISYRVVRGIFKNA